MPLDTVVIYELGGIIDHATYHGCDQIATWVP